MHASLLALTGSGREEARGTPARYKRGMRLANSACETAVCPNCAHSAASIATPTSEITVDMPVLSPSVLVAEDNEDIRELVSHQLRRMGIDVIVAEDGRRALDLALAARPTLVLMDMDMPVMSGFDAVAALRAQGYTGQIYALTAYQDGPEADRALASGCDALLGKPIRSERLRNHVAQALGCSAEAPRA